MGVPKSRHTKSKRERRRAHIFLREPFLIKCLKCGKKILPHTVCWNCGYYKGEKVIDILEKLEAKERKEREREIKEKEKESREKPLSWKELSRK